MTIRLADMDPNSPLRYLARLAHEVVQLPTDLDCFATAQALSVWQAGSGVLDGVFTAQGSAGALTAGQPGNLAFPSRLTFTWSAGSSATDMNVYGLNQFGEQVVWSTSKGSSVTTVRTDVCFSQIRRVEILATETAAVTLAIGVDVPTNGTMILPMPFIPNPVSYEGLLSTTSDEVAGVFIQSLGGMTFTDPSSTNPPAPVTANALIPGLFSVSVPKRTFTVDVAPAGASSGLTITVNGQPTSIMVFRVIPRATAFVLSGTQGS